MPAFMASLGERIFAFSPPMSTSPSKPPVEWMTGMPNSTFISVDFPAPFSPSSAWISPGRTDSDTSESTVVSPYRLVMFFISSTYSAPNACSSL